MSRPNTKKLKIISYNLRRHKANLELAGLIEKYQADILCVQECDSDQMPDRLNRLILADKTRDNRLDLAIYFNPRRFESLISLSFPLKKSFHDRIFLPANEQLLVTKLSEKQTGREFVIGSFHAACLTAINSTRRKQIAEAHEILKQIGINQPTIMVGDYNYPVFKKNLKIYIEKTGYELSKSDKPTYYIAKLLRGHYDLATSINAKIEQVRTLPKGLSDHAPILIQAHI